MTSLHAEVNCIKNIKHRKKYRLLVLKYNKRGELVDSRPCSDCKNSIVNCGFTNVYFSTEDGSIVKRKLSDLETRVSKSQDQFSKYGFNPPMIT